ncbi:hypothetical protein FVEN_g908 [Fusarium venenatum]|uniref:Uncharacterized protein n=1 Tax=Fusarium venenatum TaxID=56646 RepID=A0A2L2TI01_9HYPO|nr:uncharacterized protein FVRRES_10679 [Fusarium venenatum]KAG8361185.1 hypothetical protein FVEN_g908 [Fusarium venenatum]KAH6967267.1 hypothetical protein EDB82DRAFT_355828 [Fusarium venenatum]CEI70602.1 unnamed protein product [Fusarium venenatum]
MSSNIKDKIVQLGSKLKHLRILKQTDEHDTMSQIETTSVGDSHPASHAEDDQAIATSTLTPISPMESTNPHPYLSISTAFLQDAIKEYLNPESWYERSILRLKFTDKGEGYPSFFALLKTVHGEWRWIPHVATDASISPRDVELVSMKDDMIRTWIDRKEHVFEHPRNVGQVSPIGTAIKLDLSVPEHSRWRILVWRLHVNSGKPSSWMDRRGRVVADPRADLHQRVTETKD